MSDLIKVYLAVKMTNRFCDEVVAESDMLQRVCLNYGFMPLSPVFREAVPNVHEVLTPASKAELVANWRGDKSMLKDADILLDYMTKGTSNGVNNEIGYTRFGLWKPVVRVWPEMPLNISQLEDDARCDNLIEAMEVIKLQWGTFDKLREWRVEILNRSMMPWLAQQHAMNNRYGIHRGLNIL